MVETATKKASLKEFPKVYWMAIVFEFFERGSYYGMMSILSVYMAEYLRFSKEGVGIIMGAIIPVFVYGLPLITGAVADRMGFRRTLIVAFALMGIGYFLTSQMSVYALFFISFAVLGIGAGTFKPIISGTIAKVTDERTSTLGFGIFYWTINLGAFLVPLFVVPALKTWNPELQGYDCSNIFIAGSITLGLMLIPTIFMYKEPTKEIARKESLLVTISEIYNKIWMVFKDWKFILFIFIYSWFWILYFQMFISVLWYVNDFVDAGSFNAIVNASVMPIFNTLIGWITSIFGMNFSGIVWKFDVEHVTVINAGTIILLQLFISKIVNKTKALPTILTGISMGTLGMLILAVSSNIWIFMAGIVIFSIGEMTAHPKYISYLGLIAPPDKKATYMGFGFLYGCFGAFIGKPLGGFLYPLFVDNPMISYVNEHIVAKGSEAILKANSTINEILIAAEKVGLDKADVEAQAHTSELWLVFSGIGVLCIIGLLLYQKFIGVREAGDLN